MQVVPAPSSAESDKAIESKARQILGLDENAQDLLPVRVEKLWRTDRFAANVPFVGSLLIPMGSASDVGILKECIARIVRRHHALRTHFGVRGGRPIQIVSEPYDPELKITAISRADLLPSEEKDPKSPLNEFLGTPIDLYSSGQVYFRGFKDADHNFFLGIVLHHYLGDAWSAQIIQNEIGKIYRSLSSGAQPDLPPAAQYMEYAGAQRASLEKSLDSHLSFWRKRLSNISPSNLPYDKKENTGKLGRLFFSIEPSVVARLRTVSIATRSSLAMICLAAFHLALSKWSGSSEIVSAVTAADRANPQFRNTVGFLNAATPLISRIDLTTSISTFLKEVAKDFFDSFPYQALAVELCDEIFSPPQPFCPTRFNFVPYKKGFYVGHLSDDVTSPDILPAKALKKSAIYREIYLNLIERPDDMSGRIHYDDDLFTQTNAASFVAIYKKVLKAIGILPSVSLDAILMH